MNLGEARTKLRARVGNPTTGDVADAVLTDVINRSVEEVQDRFRFRSGRAVSTINTVAGQVDYNLPSNALVVTNVGNTTQRTKLTMRDDSWFNEHQGMFYDVNGITPTYTGAPENYIHYGSMIKVLPVPDKVYEIRVSYRTEHTVLSNDNTVLPLPVVWHEGVIIRARAMYYSDRQDIPKATMFFDEWKKWVSEKPNEVDEDNFWDNEEGVDVPSLRRGRLRRRDFYSSD